MLRRFLPYHQIFKLSSSSSASIRFCSSTTTKTKIIKPLSVDAQIGKCVSSNDYQKAIQILLESKSSSSISLSSLKATMFVCERNNKHQEAIDLAQKLDAEKRLHESTWKDEAALATLLRLKAFVGDLDGAAVCLKMILMNSSSSTSSQNLKKNEKNQSRQEKSLKRRSVAPLIEGYRRKILDSSTSKEKKEYYTSCAIHLFNECEKHRTELFVEDLENFAQIFQVAIVLKDETGEEKVKRLQELNKIIARMIREFVDHTPILNEEEQVEEINNNNQELQDFESLLRICENDHHRSLQDCEIHQISGTCSLCNNKLDASPLTLEDAKQLQNDIETTLIQHACKKNPRRENAIRAGFKAFQNHILTRKPDILLDGANLGYYGLSSWYHLAKQEKLEQENKIAENKKRMTKDEIIAASKFNKKNLTFVDVSPNLHFVDLAFEQMIKEEGKKKPLVVLHERHLEPRNLLPSYIPIVEKWRRQNAVFATPSGLNDDICWLWAIVNNTITTTTNTSSVNKNHDCTILTNDAMRDHHFALLSRRAFLRLRDRKQVKFSAKWTGNETQLFIHPAPVYSSFVQKNGKKWHVPYYYCCSSEGEGNDNNNAGAASEGEDDEKRKDIIAKWKCF